MFKLFKNKGETVKKAEVLPKEIEKPSQEKAPDLETQEDPEVEKEAFRKSIDEVIKYLKNNDGRIDPETIEMITGKPIDAVFESLADQKLELNLEQLKSSISATIDDMDNKPSVLEFFRKQFKKPAAKAAFVTLMLFLKFAPDLQAMERGSEDKVEDKTEVVKENKEVEDGKTYEAKADDFQGDRLDSEVEYEDLERYSKLDLSNYFDTDKADISEDNLNEIKDSFSKFLNTINSDNYKQVMASDFKLLGSSDYRPTNRWDRGNEGLTEARLQAVQNALQELLDNYDFLSSDLSEEEIKDIKAKGFVLEMPEKGVALISDLINPDTNEKFTEQEIEDIKNNDPERYNNLLAQCRYVKAEFLSPKSVDNLERLNPIKPEFNPPMEVIKPQENPLTQFNNFDNVIVAADNSPSMIKCQALADFIAQQEELKDTKLTFKTFSDRLDRGGEVLNSFEELTDRIVNMEKKGSSREFALKSAISALDRLADPGVSESNAVFMLTDEALQGITLADINEAKLKSDLKQAQIFFVIAHDRGEGWQEIMSLEDLEIAYYNAHWERMNQAADRIITTQENRIADLENLISSAEERIAILIQRLNRVSNKDDSQKSIAERNERLKDYQSRVAQAQAIADALKSVQEIGDPVALMELLEENGRDIASRPIRISGGGKRFAVVD